MYWLMQWHPKWMHRFSCRARVPGYNCQSVGQRSNRCSCLFVCLSRPDSLWTARSDSAQNLSGSSVHSQSDNSTYYPAMCPGQKHSKRLCGAARKDSRTMRRLPSTDPRRRCTNWQRTPETAFRSLRMRWHSWQSESPWKQQSIWTYSVNFSLPPGRRSYRLA